MKMTTLCYIEKDNNYLMLHRTKKENDINKGKWIGVGGHAEGCETPEECLLREVKEETGLTLTAYRFRGLITFISDECEPEPRFYSPLFCNFSNCSITLDHLLPLINVLKKSITYPAMLLIILQPISLCIMYEHL